MSLDELAQVLRLEPMSQRMINQRDGPKLAVLAVQYP